MPYYYDKSVKAVRAYQSVEGTSQPQRECPECHFLVVGRVARCPRCNYVLEPMAKGNRNRVARPAARKDNTID
jgi:hypothetical protein